MAAAGPGIQKRRVVPGADASVLLVDDDAVLLRTTERLLEHRGFRVVGVDTAEAALDLLSSGRRFDLLMTDVGLRHASGTDLARRACQMQPGLRVLYVSGADAASCGLEVGPASGSQAFLGKPYTGRELDDRLCDLLLDGPPVSPTETASSARVTSRDRVR